MTVVITGANRGLGYETALALADDPDRTLVLAGRDMDSLLQAAARIREGTGNQNLVPMHVDLADLDSARAFAADFCNRPLPPLTTIIANAAVSRVDRAARSAQGYELTFAVNHLGHFLLVHLLLDLLHPPARILFVSSSRHDPAQAAGPMPAARYESAEWLANPEKNPEYDPAEDRAGARAYATSKLCNVLFTYELARRLENAGLSSPERPITVNAFNPGLVAGTGLARNSTGLTRVMWYYVMPAFSRLFGFGRTAARSGSDLAYLAVAPDLRNVTATYFDGRQAVDSSDASYDLDKAADLWDTSVRLSDLQPQESPLLTGRN